MFDRIRTCKNYLRGPIPKLHRMPSYQKITCCHKLHSHCSTPDHFVACDSMIVHVFSESDLRALWRESVEHHFLIYVCSGILLWCLVTGVEKLLLWVSLGYGSGKVQFARCVCSSFASMLFGCAPFPQLFHFEIVCVQSGHLVELFHRVTGFFFN